MGFANRKKFSQERIWVLPIEKSLTQKKKSLTKKIYWFCQEIKV
jgi:hypothetical protein